MVKVNVAVASSRHNQYALSLSEIDRFIQGADKLPTAGKVLRK